MSQLNNNFPTLYVLYDETKKKFFIGKNRYVSIKKYAKLYTLTEADNKIEEMKEEGIILEKQLIVE